MKIVLLDRDGTVIKDPLDERVDREDKIELFPDSITALNTLADHGFSVIFITNQAGISEGRISETEFWRLHNIVLSKLEQSKVKVLKTYMCPHGSNDNCQCRKPKPTMILEAIKEYRLTPAETFMVGDHRSDVLAGRAAGCKTILVQTATNGQDEAPEADFVAQNITAAINFALS